MPFNLKELLKRLPAFQLPTLPKPSNGSLWFYGFIHMDLIWSYGLQQSSDKSQPWFFIVVVLSGTPEFPLWRNVAGVTFVTLNWGQFIWGGAHIFLVAKLTKYVSCIYLHRCYYMYVQYYYSLKFDQLSPCDILKNIKSIFVILNLHWD